MPMYTLWQDIRFSVRVLARHRGFAVTSITVLALGIGINAGIFGLINSLLLRPRTSTPVAGELVGVHSMERETTGDSRAFSYPNYADLREAAGPFSQLAAHNMAMAGVTDKDITRRRWSTSSRPISSTRSVRLRCSGGPSPSPRSGPARRRSSRSPATPCGHAAVSPTTSSGGRWS
jgi:hypothetical protein